MIAGGITLASLLISFLLPESPVFLVTQNKLERARIALALLRNLRKFLKSFRETKLKLKFYRQN